MSMTRREAVKALSGLAISAALPKMRYVTHRDFYDEALVIDGLTFGKDWDTDDFSALREANYSGIVNDLYPRATLQDAINAMTKCRTRVLENSDRLMLALRSEDFRLAQESKKTSVLMSFQDATIFEDEENNVSALHDLGLRCAQLTYNYRNLLGDGCLERTDAGLSEFGVRVVAEMNRVGVLIDLSHCGPSTTEDGIAFSDKPVAITHTMCESMRPGHPRAKTDTQIRNCADKGGVIGIAALGYFIGPDPGGTTTIDTYADHIEHAVNVAGIDHVGLSTDFQLEGISPWATRETWYEPRLKTFKPSYEVRWPPWIPELDTPNRFRNLSHVLERRGWVQSDIEKLLGLNWLRLFQETID